MANTFKLITSNTLTATTGTVTFSSIPSTFTDLFFQISIRKTTGSDQNSDIAVTFNSEYSGTNYSKTSMESDGANVTSNRQSDTSAQYLLDISSGATSTSNTFSAVEIYIPNYNLTGYKPLGVFGGNENNTTTANMLIHAGEWRGTSGITSVEFRSLSPDFAVGSSFYLYGINNS